MPADNHIGDHGDATAVAGAVVASHVSGQITSEALVTAAGADYVLTITHPLVIADSVVLASVFNGTNTTVGLAINSVTPALGSVAIRVRNTHASSALNGTIVVSFVIH